MKSGNQTRNHIIIFSFTWFIWSFFQWHHIKRDLSLLIINKVSNLTLFEKKTNHFLKIVVLDVNSMVNDIHLSLHFFNGKSFINMCRRPLSTVQSRCLLGTRAWKSPLVRFEPKSTWQRYHRSVPSQWVHVFIYFSRVRSTTCRKWDLE